MKIRKATSNDREELAVLMEQLGYQTSIEQMEIRLAAIDASPNHYTLVACDEKKVVGRIGFHTDFLYNKDGIYARIIAFVADSTYRNRGGGRMLLAEVERFAKELGVVGIGLNSGNRPERANAHQFYNKMGYDAASTGFSKILT
ncbi:GNAT family N-acetyltransferase [Niallia sp.]|uniref:GNAT family N-acetyltransferase n=1 Tax=Niallia sp. TaxID=2837523 RepID=UPI00289E329D|nr:GNAT family N-acetyltransferase [Niallia sp.]